MTVESIGQKPRHPFVQRILATALKRYRREEDGAVVALALYMFVLFLIMGGIGLDTMRHEMERANIQATLDAAVLAGASTNTQADAKAAVEDYFAKSGMSQYLNEIKEEDIIVTLGSAKVTASASMELDTYLLSLAGVDMLTAGGASTAEKHIPKLEIVLVLDVSGSMNVNSKIQNLRKAAKTFVDEMMGADADAAGNTSGNVIISIVPFSTSVTPSDEMYKEIAVNEKHDYSNCVYFESNDYNHASLGTGNHGLSEGSPMKQQIYTSLYGDYEDLNSAWRSCYTDQYFRILPYSINTLQLKGKIDTLLAAGNTSTEQGIKWGSAMLHPTFREVSASLIADNVIPAQLAPHPVNYDDPDTLKVLIVMGDGANTTTYFFDKSSPRYRGKHSDVYEVITETMEFDHGYYEYDRDTLYYGADGESRCGTRKFTCEYTPSGEIFSNHYLKDNNPSGDRVYYDLDAGGDISANSSWLSNREFGDLTDKRKNPEFVSVDALDWEIAWGLMSPDFYGEVTGDWRPWNDYRYSEQITGSMKDERMGRVCDASKTKGAIHYSIGFEIPKGGAAETALKDCASSDANYFRAEGLSITDAFSAIAQNVQNLRLTQ